MNTKLFQVLLLTSAFAFIPLVEDVSAKTQQWKETSIGSPLSINSHILKIAQNSNNLPPLNQAVYTYAQSMLGQQVGDGECATLVSEALNYAGAKNFWELGPTGPDANYIWGTFVATLFPGSTSTGGILVGDIIQFYNVQTYHKTVNPDGSWSESSYSYPHHTAIVSNVLDSQIILLHQNVNGSRIVQLGTLDLNDVKSGTMWVYRSIAK